MILAIFHNDLAWVKYPNRKISWDWKFDATLQFSHSNKNKGIIREKEVNSQQDCCIEIISTHCAYDDLALFAFRLVTFIGSGFDYRY